MTITIDQQEWRKVLAEVVGTFFFFFIGIGGGLVVGNQAGALGILYAALAHGVALAIAISALGHISGAHFNPAVTIALMIARKINPVLALLYIIGQLLGGVLSCLALITIVPEGVWKPASLGTPAIGVWKPADKVLPIMDPTQAILLEAILTFFLVMAVFGTAVDPRANKVAGFAIGLTVFVDILAGGPLSGGVMNPARAITPALVSGNWTNWYVWWIGPIAGAIVASIIYTYIFLPRGDEPVVVTPTITDEPLEPPMSEPGMIK